MDYGSLVVKGSEAQDLLKEAEVGGKCHLEVEGVVKEISMHRDYEVGPGKVGDKAPKEIPHVRIDISKVKKISTKDYKNI